jgi:hypothetical protein
MTITREYAIRLHNGTTGNAIEIKPADEGMIEIASLDFGQFTDRISVPIELAQEIAKGITEVCNLNSAKVKFEFLLSGVTPPAEGRFGERVAQQHDR